MGKNKVEEKIALCRMFSGEYWENPNNIGYESINMFLPKGEEEKDERISYMYLPANGDYDIKKIEIKYVLLTQHIAKKLIPTGTTKKNKTGTTKKNKKGEDVYEKNTKTIVKVIGIAKVEEETFKNDYKKLNGQDSSCKNYNCIGGGTEFDIMSFLYEKFANENITKEDIKEDIIEELREKLKAIKEKDRTKYIKSIFDGTVEKISLVELHEKSKILAKVHNKQDDDVRKIIYGDSKTLKEIFTNNSSFGDLNILLTLKVTGLSFPKENIYLTNDKVLFSNFITKGDKVIVVDTNVSSQKQTTYIDFKKEFMDEILATGKWEDANELNIDKFEKEFEASFLTLVGKENDEIAYSNLFAHFLSYPDFCKEFFCHLGILNIIPNRVDREEANIDILVKSSDKTIVIENKIKSALNGHTEEDVNGEEYRNQLKRYFEYVERKYKNAKYFIFAPDYNPVNQENFGVADVNGKKIKMKDEWEVVRYSKILEFCELYNGFIGTKEEWNFNEFKKALKVHTIKSLQNYYRDMQIRMRKLFNK